MVRGRRCRTGATFQACWWLVQVLDLTLDSCLPESGHPLETPVGIMPVTRYPALSPRWISPDTTDPDEIFSFIIPTPVSGNPGHTILFRLVLRRFLGDRLGGSLRNDNPCLRIMVHLLRKCLVKWAAAQDFHVLLYLGPVTWRRSCLLTIDSNDSHHQHHEGHQDHCITGKGRTFHFLSSFTYCYRIHNHRSCTRKQVGSTGIRMHKACQEYRAVSSRPLINP